MRARSQGFNVFLFKRIPSITYVYLLSTHGTSVHVPKIAEPNTLQEGINTRLVLTKWKVSFLSQYRRRAVWISKELRNERPKQFAASEHSTLTTGSRARARVCFFVHCFYFRA